MCGCGTPVARGQPCAPNYRPCLRGRFRIRLMNRATANPHRCSANPERHLGHPFLASRFCLVMLALGISGIPVTTPPVWAQGTALMQLCCSCHGKHASCVQTCNPAGLLELTQRRCSRTRALWSMLQLPASASLDSGSIRLHTLCVPACVSSSTAVPFASRLQQTPTTAPASRSASALLMAATATTVRPVILSFTPICKAPGASQGRTGRGRRQDKRQKSVRRG